MKRMSGILALVSCAILASDVVAQQLHQPRSVRPVAYNHGYIGFQKVEPSPSDRPGQPPAPMEDTDIVSAESGLAISPVALNGGSGCGCTTACGSCDGCNGCGGNGGCACGGDEPWTLFSNSNCPGIKIGGWFQSGYYDESNGLFNSHPDRFRTSQLWMYIEREADGSCGLDLGFRFDAVYGTDAQDTQSFGNPPGSWDFLNGFDHGIYGWALPQAYVEVASGDWSMKIGHFFTIVGYEVVTAPGNFFFSHALTMYNSEPFTHTGVLSTYSLTDEIEVYSGWTLGWDTGFDQLGDGSNYLGGIGLQLTDEVKMTYVTTVGDMGDFLLPAAPVGPNGRGDGYAHSLVFDVELTENINYVWQSDLVSLNNGFGPQHNDEIGINQYFIYSLNDCWSYGTRIEWWKSDNGFDYGGQATAPGGSISYYEYTTGVNYMPHPNVMIRPEGRVDWSPAANFDQTTFAIDVIVTY